MGVVSFDEPNCNSGNFTMGGGELFKWKSSASAISATLFAIVIAALALLLL